MKKGSAKLITIPQKKVKAVSWPDYFAKMDPTERILFAYMAFKQPKNWGINDFSSYNRDSFRYLDDDVPGPVYQEIVKMISKWNKMGFLISGNYSGTHNLEEGAAMAFWQWLGEQTAQVALEFKPEPEQTYVADLAGTLDNILNFLMMIERGEVQITRTKEINKNSLKRVLSALTEPGRPHGLFSLENYFFWLLGLTQFFKWIWVSSDRLVLTPLGRELPENMKVEEFIYRIIPDHLRSISHKGALLLLPLLANCTQWTSWFQMVKSIIPADQVGNLFQKGRTLSLLDPLRFLGLLDWGELQDDILVRATPLGQLLLPKILYGQDLDEYASEVKVLTDQVYLMNGPDTAYVQPNFEILVPRSASWAVRWELGQFAILEQQDQMLKYRLDKAFLMNALKRGMPSGEVITLLTRLSPYPLPENIVLTIQQWVDSFGQVTFMQLSLLECTTPEQAASIASSRKYREYVLGLFSPTVVIVREPEKLRKLLEKQGIFPLPGVLDGEGAAKRKGRSLSS